MSRCVWCEHLEQTERWAWSSAGWAENKTRHYSALCSLELMSSSVSSSVQMLQMNINITQVMWSFMSLLCVAKKDWSPRSLLWVTLIKWVSVINPKSYASLKIKPHYLHLLHSSNIQNACIFRVNPICGRVKNMKQKISPLLFHRIRQFLVQ